MIVKTIFEFKKKKEFLFLTDSDGCVMDTMTIKHEKCFGPCMIKEWELSLWEAEILNIWNKINLYGITRGINRFKGLALTLSEVNYKFRKIEGVSSLLSWVDGAKELSNDALKSVINENPEEEIFKKALSWSISTNKAIENISLSEKLPFPCAKKALEFARGQADVAVISSANLDALHDEWQRHGLFPLVDAIASQSDGSKAGCIERLVTKGYDRSKVVMCGDSVGDYEAAKNNGVFFYPILACHENESWQEFISDGFDRLTSGSFKEYGEEKMRQFYKNLNNNH